MCSMKRLVKRTKWVAELAPGPTRRFLISSSYCPLTSPSFPLSPPSPLYPVPSPSIPPAIPLPSSPLNHNRMVPFSAQSQFANWKIAVSAASVSRQPSLTRLNPNEKQDGRQNHPPTCVSHQATSEGRKYIQSTVSTDDFHTKRISEQQS